MNAPLAPAGSMPSPGYPDLDDLVGLASVKAKMSEFADFVEFGRLRRVAGLGELRTPMLHSVFMGNPGTGKTTVAERMGSMLAKLGLLSNGKVWPEDRASLIGRHIGDSENNLKEAVRRAQGGVLFIDEAYSLATREGSWDFGQKMIDALVKLMDAHRGEFVVIVAGYPAQMKEFLGSNPGLRGRFGLEFQFEDYSSEELFQIFHAQLVAQGLEMDPGAVEAARAAFGRAVTSRGDDFSNGRLARTWSERVVRAMGSRVVHSSGRDPRALSLVLADDVHSSLS